MESNKKKTIIISITVVIAVFVAVGIAYYIKNKKVEIPELTVEEQKLQEQLNQLELLKQGFNFPKLTEQQVSEGLDRIEELKQKSQSSNNSAQTTIISEQQLQQELDVLERLKQQAR